MATRLIGLLIASVLVVPPASVAPQAGAKSFDSNGVQIQYAEKGSGEPVVLIHGFTGSYARHIEGWYRGLGGTLASGPPARRILELIALVDAGLIVPIGPDMRVERTRGGFAASSPAIPGVSHECRGLLEAHLPSTDFARSANPLLRALNRRGMARPYLIKDAQAADFTSGAIEVGPSPYLVLDADGNAQPGLFATGVPLESIHWGTQLGPLANTNSQFLRDSDAIAIAVLGHGKGADESHPAYQAASTGGG